MTSAIEIVPLTGPFNAEVRVPGSKSMTNRALVLAALADGESVIENALSSDDTERMVEALRALGIAVATDEGTETMKMGGRGGMIPASRATLDVGASGTCARFLTALVALGTGQYVVDGTSRMRERPMQPLLSALALLGAEVATMMRPGCPPVHVGGRGLSGGEVAMDASVSSQFVTALLMVAPYATHDVTLRLTGTVVSRPYIDMTLQQMRRAGVSADWIEATALRVVAGQRYRAGVHVMESDASNASYLFAAAAVTGGRVLVPRLPAESIQGDLALLHVLADMGARVTRHPDAVEVQGPPQLTGVTVDANAFPDMAQTIAALAPFATGVTEIRNVASMRVKETDRIDAVATELRRLGQSVETGSDWIRIAPRPVVPATVQTYDDHRMAMAFSIVGLRTPGVRIADPSCVAKTFPGYWDTLRLAGVSMGELEPSGTLT